MDESRYIFDQGSSLITIGIIIGIMLIIMSINQLFKLRDYSLSKDERIKIMMAVVSLLVLGIGVVWASYKDNNPLKGIKQNYAEIYGITTDRKEERGGPVIWYKFIVNSKTFTQVCGCTYSGFTIPNIKVPGGRYKVIYNSKNPDESVMDFKAPAPGQ